MRFEEKKVVYSLFLIDWTTENYMMIKKLTLQITLLVLLFSGINTSYSQSVIIGSGTAVNGPTESSPINIWYRKN